MADTVNVPWWAKAPIYLQAGILGVPSLIALLAVGALWIIASKQYDLIVTGQAQTAKAQQQTDEALELYKTQSGAQTDALRAIADKIAGSFQHVTNQHDKLLQMELFTCKTAAHNLASSEQCSAFMRDLNEHLVNESRVNLVDGLKASK